MPHHYHEEEKPPTETVTEAESILASSVARGAVRGKSQIREKETGQWLEEKNATITSTVFTDSHC